MERPHSWLSRPHKHGSPDPCPLPQELGALSQWAHPAAHRGSHVDTPWGSSRGEAGVLSSHPSSLLPRLLPVLEEGRACVGVLRRWPGSSARRPRCEGQVQRARLGDSKRETGHLEPASARV